MRLFSTVGVAMAKVAALAALLGDAGCASAPPESLVRLDGGPVAYRHRAGAADRPTVVLQAGLGDGLSVWNGVWNSLPAGLPVWAYDRPGYGRSPAQPGVPRDPCAIADELRVSLKAAGVAPPYLLAGHSIGGLYQYVFARLYPQDVAGVLLVDATHPDHWMRMQREAPAAAGLASALRATLFTGVMRAEFDAQAAPACTARWAGMPPLAVPAYALVRGQFSAAERGPFETLVRRLEVDWLQLAPGMVRREVHGAGHYIQTERPDAVVEALARLTQSQRQP